MKKNARKIVALFIVCVLILSMQTITMADTINFSDVSTEDWFFESVTEMTNLGLFSGKGKNTDGSNYFAPKDSITKAEFITVTARIILGDKIVADQNTEWWRPYYNALIGEKVIYSDSFDVSEINNPITRLEMARIVSNTLRYKGEDFNSLNIRKAYDSIPDITTTESVFDRRPITEAYAAGILTGTDSVGTFSPNGILNRAEATVVFQRIIREDLRANEAYKFPKGEQYVTQWINGSMMVGAELKMDYVPVTSSTKIESTYFEDDKTGFNVYDENGNPIMFGYQ